MENYSNYYFRKEKKVPSILVLSVLVGMIFAVNTFINKPTVTSTQASPTKIDRFEFINETNNSVTVFWRTQNETTGWIVYGDEAGKTDKIAYDKRDFEGNPKKYKNHFVTIRTLNDNTKYFFYLVIDNKIIKNSIVPLTFLTKNKIAAKSNSEPAVGRVVGKNSLPLDRGIVFLKIEGIGIQGTLTESTGEWIIPTYYLTKKNTSEQFFPSDETPVEIEIFDELNNLSIVRTFFNQINPVPQTIKLGEDSSFEMEKKSSETEATTDAKIKKENVLAATTTTLTTKPDLEINFPKENATIDSGKPLFKGIAPIGAKLLALISSKNNQKNTTQKYFFYTDDKGKWSYSPLANLNAGAYVFNISFTNDKDKEIIATRNFTIIKSGESVLGNATPEAITEIMTSSSTPTITPYRKPPTPTDPVTVSGDNMTPIMIGSIALTIIGLGLVLIF